nr:GGDEF domain-containing protein [Oscillospiraceae bacterium]
RDSLTGMLNRRGFDDMSRDMMHSLDEKHLICTMVLDMDGLKHINDDFGHYEGDRAIKALANIITKCCDSGEICARTGGDEFYIFAVDYSQKKLDRFIERLNNFVESYNKSYSKAYDLAVSYGTYLTEADKNSKFDDLLKVSDTRMYEQKMTKPNRRK